jgi:hypothetical protein
MWPWMSREPSLGLPKRTPRTGLTIGGRAILEISAVGAQETDNKRSANGLTAVRMTENARCQDLQILTSTAGFVQNTSLVSASEPSQQTHANL